MQRWQRNRMTKLVGRFFFPDTVYFWDYYFSAFMNLPFLHKTFCSVRCHCSTHWQSFKLDVLSVALASPLTFRPGTSIATFLQTLWSRCPLTWHPACGTCDCETAGIIDTCSMFWPQLVGMYDRWLRFKFESFSCCLFCSSMFLCSSKTTYVASCLAAW